MAGGSEPLKYFVSILSSNLFNNPSMYHYYPHLRHIADKEHGTERVSKFPGRTANEKHSWAQSKSV